MKPQVVLSLFDGMSCGQIALNRLGIPIKTYYASEIDPYPIKVTQANYPDTIQLGDVCDVKAADLPKIDILLAGSPCTGFSFAGKQLAFNDPQSVLFFEFVRLLKECKPKYFLLENVKMKKEYLNVITELVGVKPVFINSALLSAQNRQRWYWTNIPGIEQPEDKKIVLRDILETNPDSYTLMSNKFSKRQEGRNCLVDMNKEKASNLSAMEYVKNGRQGDYLACDDTGIPKDLSETHDTPKKINPSKKKYISKESVEKYVEDVNAEFNDPYNKKTIKGDKSTTFRTNSSNGNMWVNEKAIKETHDKPIKVGNIYPSGGQNGNIFSADGKSPTLSAGQGKTGRGIGSNNSPKIETHDTPKQVGTASDINGHDILKRVYSPDGKAPTLNTMGGGNREPKVVGGAWRGRYEDDKSIKQNLELRKDGKTNSLTTVQKDNVVVENETYWRKLTPIECERLQTVPDNYTNHVSNSRRYQMLGNGWTIEVIVHILKNMEV